MVQPCENGNAVPCTSSQQQQFARPLQLVFSAQAQRDNFINPDYALALFMGLHSRLGKDCSFSALDPNSLKIILDYCPEPDSMINFILLDLHVNFPDLVPSWAFDIAVSWDKAAACVNRLYSFLMFLSRVIEKDSQCSGFGHSQETVMKSTSSKPSLSGNTVSLHSLLPLTLSNVLSIMPGQRLRTGVVDHYLLLIAHVLGSEYVFAVCGQMYTYSEGTQMFSRKAFSPRPKLIAPSVIEMLSSSLGDSKNGDDFSFSASAQQLQMALGPSNPRSVCFVSGSNFQSSKDITGAAWITVKLDTHGDKLVSRVLDSSSEFPNLRSYRIFDNEAAELFASLSQENNQDFMQLPERAAYQGRFPQTPSYCYALLNCANQLVQGAPPLDDVLFEIHAAALRVHFATYLFHQLIKFSGSALNLSDLFQQWNSLNTIPYNNPDSADTCLAKVSRTIMCDAGDSFPEKSSYLCLGGNSASESCSMDEEGSVPQKSGEGGEGGGESGGNPALRFEFAAAAAAAAAGSLADMEMDTSHDRTSRVDSPLPEACILTCSSCRNRSAFIPSQPIRLNGPGYLLANGTKHHLDMTFDLSIDPSDRYCLIQAILREIFRWDEEVYKQVEHLSCPLDSKFDRTRFVSSLRRWRVFAKLFEETKDTSSFRRYVAGLLLDARNDTVCHHFFERGPSEDDLYCTDMTVAETRARELRFKFNLGHHVHRWAVAILHPNFQFCIKIIQFLLHLEFGNVLGIALVNRLKRKDTNSKNPHATSQDVQTYYFCPEDQPAIMAGPGVRIIMAVLREAANFQRSTEEPGSIMAIRKQVVDMLACSVSGASAGAGILRMQVTDSGSSKESLSTFDQLVDQKIDIEIARQCSANFSDFHYFSLSIKAGSYGLPLWIYADEDRAGVGSANFAGDVAMNGGWNGLPSCDPANSGKPGQGQLNCISGLWDPDLTWPARSLRALKTKVAKRAGDFGTDDNGADADADDDNDAAAAATVDAVSGNSTDSVAAAAVPVAATGGSSVCLHFSCIDRRTKALLIGNKGLVLVRHGEGNVKISAGTAIKRMTRYCLKRGQSCPSLDCSCLTASAPAADRQPGRDPPPLASPPTTPHPPLPTLPTPPQPPPPPPPKLPTSLTSLPSAGPRRQTAAIPLAPTEDGPPASPTPGEEVPVTAFLYCVLTTVSRRDFTPLLVLTSSAPAAD